MASVKGAAAGCHARRRALEHRNDLRMMQRSRAVTGKGAKGAPPSRPTIKDVAERCGVHPSTVSRALSPAMSHLVAPDVAKRIRAAATALGYQPNVTAAGLRTGRSGLIGVLAPDIADPGFPPILSGITETLGARGLCHDRRRRRARSLARTGTGRQTDRARRRRPGAGDRDAERSRGRPLPRRVDSGGAGQPQRLRAKTAGGRHRRRSGHAARGRPSGRVGPPPYRPYRGTAGCLDRRAAPRRLQGRRGARGSVGAKHPDRDRARLYARRGPTGGAAPARPRAGADRESSPPTTCSRSASTTRSASAACNAPPTSRWSATTTCLTSTCCRRR